MYKRVIILIYWHPLRLACSAELQISLLWSLRLPNTLEMLFCVCVLVFVFSLPVFLWCLSKQMHTGALISSIISLSLVSSLCVTHTHTHTLSLSLSLYLILTIPISTHNMLTHSLNHVCIYLYVYVRSLARSHLHTHTCIHIHSLTHIYTHTHTLSLSLSPLYCSAIRFSDGVSCGL
jgi:hypothetical protein